MERLDEIIRQSTAAIEQNYILLPIDGGDPVYRERVYCYELYHQMRLRWGRERRYFLNGEVHKGGHPKLKDLVGVVMPDLLVHGPGHMEDNHAIIEVKGPNAADDGIIKDVGTLSNFLTHVHYDRAIYLIYGTGERNDQHWVDRVRAALNGVRVPIELWLHRHVRAPAEVVANFG